MEKLLTEICTPKQWKTISTSELLDKGYEVYGANGVIGYYNKYTHKNPTLMITCRGATCGTLNISRPFSYINGNAMALDNLDDSIDMKYLYYYLTNRGLKDTISGSAQPQITRVGLSNVKINYPNIEIQKKIVEVLDKSQELINKRKEQIKLLDELVKSRFVDMFGDINDYISISSYVKSLTSGKSLAGETECKNRVLNTSSISYDYYDYTKSKNLPLDYNPQEEHLVREGDVLISRMNTSELVGATAYVWKTKDNIYIPDRIWKVNFKSDVNPIFFWQLLIQKNTKEKIRRIASGTSGSMKNISKQNLLDIQVINVDINKQNEFAEFAKQIDKIKYDMQKSLKELDDNFNSLMQKTFKGELF